MQAKFDYESLTSHKMDKAERIIYLKENEIVIIINDLKKYVQKKLFEWYDNK